MTQITLASTAPCSVELSVKIDGFYKHIIVDGSPQGHEGVEILTHNIDGDLFKAWVEQNPDHPLLANGALRVAASAAEDQALVSNPKSGSRNKAPPASDKAPPASGNPPPASSTMSAASLSAAS